MHDYDYDDGDEGDGGEGGGEGMISMLMAIVVVGMILNITTVTLLYCRTLRVFYSHTFSFLRSHYVVFLPLQPGHSFAFLSWSFFFLSNNLFLLRRNATSLQAGKERIFVMQSRRRRKCQSVFTRPRASGFFFLFSGLLLREENKR